MEELIDRIAKTAVADVEADIKSVLELCKEDKECLFKEKFWPIGQGLFYSMTYTRNENSLFVVFDCALPSALV